MKRSVEKLTAVPRESVSIELAVQDFLAAQLRKGSAPRTIEQIEHYLGSKPVAGWKPLLLWTRDNQIHDVSQLDHDALARYLQETQSLVPTGTYYRLSVMVKRLLKYLVSEDHISELPIKFEMRKPRRKQIDVFTPDEMRKLAAVVAKENPRDYAIFHILLDTGLRANELCSLRCQDFHWDREEVLVRAETAKTRTERTLHLGSSLGPLIKYRRLREPYGVNDIGFFFLSFWSTPVVSGTMGHIARRNLPTHKIAFRKAPLTSKGLYHLVHKWGQLAGIKEARCSPHTFRHFFAVQFLRNGGNVMELQRALGHKNLEQTSEYVSYAQTDMKKARKFSPGWDYLPGRGQKLEPHS